MKNTLHILARCTGMVVAGMLSLNSFDASGQCSVVNDLTIPDAYLSTGFSGGGNFNAVIIGNYNTGDGSAEGRVAVGGNFTLNSSTTGYQVGVTAESPVTGDNFIVNGTLTHNTGNQITVRGNFYYGAVEASTPLPVHGAGEGANINGTNRVIFTGLKQHYVDLSNGYAAQASTSGPDPLVSSSDLVLTGDNTIKNYVFNVNLSGNNISTVSFVNIPVGSGILINILNTNVSLTSGATPMVTGYKDKTVFNFPNATNILLSSFNVQGGFLAPNANVSALAASDIVGPAIIGGNINNATGLNIKNSCLEFPPLPVKLISFKGKKEGEVANLAWQTTSESNADKFVVERSGKGKAWVAMGEVAAAGESVKTESYIFADKSPLHGDNLYRLKMLDKDGTFAYSRIISVDFKLKSTISAFPNPATNQVTFTAADWQKIGQVQLLSHTGKSLVGQAENGKAIEVGSLPQGLYLLKITEKNGNVSTQKILKK